ncbi:protein rep [Adhaeribacter rhizoryzae]|uniref:Uncharacterized protein n=1 Tax=Adhaeribacter rhizoryzae TaxID=2607907 RepID=A0A5M6DNX8_9BACT|nr:protein rep [Adhaeribacter rhizoryzae]KAA5549207.1 hypothetical protein F0145_01035 [Adhaeribacter rhizoryzae]
MKNDKKTPKEFCSPNQNINPVKVEGSTPKTSFGSKNQEKCKQVATPNPYPKKPSLDKLEITSELSLDSLEFDRSCEYDREKLTKRARAKFFNNNIAISLANLKSSLKEKYWDTYHCSHRVVVRGPEAKSKFCKNRWCLICNRIRTAQLIQKYNLTLESWEEKVFLTLTVKNCTAGNLRDTLDKMHTYFTEIKDSERKADRNLVGIRKLEITYNRTEDTYHPHFHFILESALSAEKVIEKWIYKFNEGVCKKTLARLIFSLQEKLKGGSSKSNFIQLPEFKEFRKGLTADPQFQDFKPADEKSVKELFKYFTKLTSNSSKDKFISPAALDIIFQNLTNRRAFQPFGFIAHQEVAAPENKGDDKTEAWIDEMEYEWIKEYSNWVNISTGDTLSDYQPSEEDLRKQGALK